MPAVSDSSSVQGGATASAATAAPAASASTSTSAVPRVSRKHARDDETAGGSKRLRDSTAHNSSVKRGDSDEERAGDGDKDATDQRSIKQQSQEKQKGQEKQTSEQKVQQGKGIYGKQELVKLLRNLNDGEGDLLANLQLECVMKLQVSQAVTALGRCKDLQSGATATRAWLAFKSEDLGLQQHAHSSLSSSRRDVQRDPLSQTRPRRTLTPSEACGLTTLTFSR
jgi:hypothetical protein